MGISYKNSDGTWSTLNVPINVKGEASGGSSKTQINLIEYQTMDEETTNKVWELYEYLYNGGTDALNKYEVSFYTSRFSGTQQMIMPATMLHASDGGTLHIYFVWMWSGCTYYGDISLRRDYPKEIRLETRILLDEYNYSGYLSSSGGDWTFTTDTYDSGLYNAKEIYISYFASEYTKNTFSHAIFRDDTLGNNTYKHFPYVSLDGTIDEVPTWFYDGGSICHNSSYGGYIEYIAYKQ
jgi:hypothetical protein